MNVLKRAFCYPVLIVCLIVIVIIGAFCRYSPVTTVILVRHAEKATEPPDDPPLTLEGTLRAQILAHVVENAGIDVIFTTELRRTRATVEPTAAGLGIAPVIIPAANTDELVASINSEHRGMTILVAGHSNTIPVIMETLGVPDPPAIADGDYDDLFVVHIRHSVFRYTRLTHLQYGVASL